MLITILFRKLVRNYSLKHLIWHPENLVAAMANVFEFLSSVQDGVWSFDIARQQFLYVNNRFAGLFGMSVEEVVKHPFSWRRYVHPDDYEFVNSETEKVYRGASVDIQYRIVVDQKIRWLRDRKSPVLDDLGNIKGMGGITTDITAQKENELKLKDSEYTFRYLFSNNPNPLWIYDVETLRFMAVNHAAIEKYGYSEEEFLSMTISDIRPREDIPKLLKSVGRVRRRYSQSEGWRHIRKDGSIIYVNISGHGIEYNKRKAELIMIHDVTPEIKSREEMRRSEINMNALINNIKDLIWSVDQNYRILSANAAFGQLSEVIYGRRLENGDSVLISTSTDSAVLSQWKQRYDKVLNGESLIFNIQVKPLNNSTFEIRMHPVLHDGQIIGVVCLGRDIQQRIDEEKRMVLQNTELREIVSLASHEIRGPVTSLMGLMNLFNKSDLADPFNEVVISHIQEATRHLDEVIHKIVDKSYSIQVDNESIYSSRQNLSGYESP